MKKSFICSVCFFLVFSVSAQEQKARELQTDHYLIAVEPGAEKAAESLARELEFRFAVYNTLFRFDPAALAEPLRVRVFADEDEAAFDSYIQAKAGRKVDALYLHHKRQENRELAVRRAGSGIPSMLPHQAFVQFLRGFIANPPAWMLEGFAVYFSTLSFDPDTEQLSYWENLEWLAEAKKIEKKSGPLKLLFDPEPDAAYVPSSQDFKIRSWALVSFFLISGLEEYYRTLTECFMLLSPSGATVDNNRIVISHINDWTDFDLMEEHYRLYLNTRKTFNELVEDGRSAYTAGNMERAKIIFLSALAQKSDHYASYYYLGLISYLGKNYEAADENYRTGIFYGADEALSYYALGLNYAAAGKNAEAVVLLRRASAADTARYGQAADDIIKRLR